MAARYGGEEFVVLLPDTPEEGALRVAERIRNEIESTGFRVSGEVLRVTVSIGVCSATPARADATKEIFTCADDALCRPRIWAGTVWLQTRTSVRAFRQLRCRRLLPRTA